MDRAFAHAPESFYDGLVAQAIAPRWSRGRIALAGDERRWRPTGEKVQRSGRHSASFFTPSSPAQLRLQQIGRRTLGRPAVSRLVPRTFIAA